MMLRPVSIFGMKKDLMIMYDLQDVMGEDVVNKGLKNFLEEFKFTIKDTR